MFVLIHVRTQLCVLAISVVEGKNKTRFRKSMSVLWLHEACIYTSLSNEPEQSLNRKCAFRWSNLAKKKISSNIRSYCLNLFNSYIWLSHKRNIGCSIAMLPTINPSHQGHIKGSRPGPPGPQHVSLSDLQAGEWPRCLTKKKSVSNVSSGQNMNGKRKDDWIPMVCFLYLCFLNVARLESPSFLHPCSTWSGPNVMSAQACKSHHSA